MATIYEVMHRWAEHNEGKRITKNGRLSSSAVVFDGPVLYSYRMPLARYFDNMVLIRSGQMRVTNAKHRNWCYRAVISKPVFVVPDINGDHNFNMTHLLNELATAKRAASTRFLYKDHYCSAGALVSWMQDRHKECVQYQDLTGCPGKVPDLQEMVDDVILSRKTKLGKYLEPKAVAQRERNAARRAAKAALNLD